MSPFYISHWNAKCLLCKTEVFCYNIDEVYTALTAERNKETIDCSHKATNLPVWEHLLIWDQAVHCLPSLQCLPPGSLPGQEQWALLQAHQWSHPAPVLLLMHISRTDSSVSCMPSYVKQEDTGSFFFFIKCVFSPLWRWQWSCWDSIKDSGAGHVGSTAAAQHHPVNLFFTKLLGENSWTVFTDL